MSVENTHQPPPFAVVSRVPREFLKQGMMHCGAYSVKAILNAYGKDSKRDPRDYYPLRWGVVQTLTDPELWARVLRSYGVEAEARSASGLFDEERLQLLKRELSRDHTFMLRIGNGYSPGGAYSAFRAAFIGHWITLWGYDDARGVFFVYDSTMPASRYAKDIPAGNAARTYKEILRDWRKGWPFSRRGDYIVITHG